MRQIFIKVHSKNIFLKLYPIFKFILNHSKGKDFPFMTIINNINCTMKHQNSSLCTPFIRLNYL